MLFPTDAIPVHTEDEARYTVILDAGHGGRDGGAAASDGTLEKTLNLAVATKLCAMLETANVRVIMTRTDDRELASPDSSHKKRDDLQARLAMTENLERAIFVSLHMNTFPVEKYSGLQVYFSPNHVESLALAERIQADALMLREDNHRAVKAAGDSIYLMTHIKIPAVLVECGFLSNREECELLKSEVYQTKLALCLYSSILGYLSDASV